MELFSAYASVIAENWAVWLVTIVLIVAAVIDGLQLRVPNWITFPLVFAGWIYSTVAFGLPGLGWSLLGTATAPGAMTMVSAIVALGLLVSGAFYFRHMERTFADVV